MDLTREQIDTLIAKLECDYSNVSPQEAQVRRWKAADCIRALRARAEGEAVANCITDETRGTRTVGPDGGVKGSLPNPSCADLIDPQFNAIWEATKTWDVNAPEYYRGYCGMNGSHVMLILNALRRAHPSPSGTRLVPEEPAPAMVFAGRDAIRANAGEGDDVQLGGDAIAAYRAMLAAAPEAK